MLWWESVNKRVDGRSLNPVLLMGVAALASILSACSSQSIGAKVAVELNEFKVTASPTTVTAGTITFDVKNVGVLPHEFIVFKTDVDPKGLPISGDRVDEERLGGKIDEIEPENLGPGKSATTVLNLAAGKYVLVCNIAGHYSAGMATAFSVN
ncbi:MAG: hypothetical protein HW397_228 [Dehalococcoidia bacterium]|nr:hypothetical protein [Dehalococcoidia bacterium]